MPPIARGDGRLAIVRDSHDAWRHCFDLAMEQSLDREMRIDASDHLFRLHGLRDEIHRACFEPPDSVLRVIERRHEDHGDVTGFRIGLEAATRLIAIDARHDDVEQNDHGFYAPGDLQPVLTTEGDKQPVVRTGERVAQEVKIRGFVIDQEDPAGVIREDCCHVIVHLSQPSASRSWLVNSSTTCIRLMRIVAAASNSSARTLAAPACAEPARAQLRVA